MGLLADRVNVYVQEVGNSGICSDHLEIYCKAEVLSCADHCIDVGLTLRGTSQASGEIVIKLL